MFIQVIQGQCSHEDDLRAVTESWRTDVGAADGWLGGTFGFTDAGIFFGVIRFASREQAMANSSRPEQDAWAQRFVAAFDSPPEFRDYDDVAVLLDGGSDDAGFVQIIQGRTANRASLDVLLSAPEELRRMRPEIVGATWAFAEDGSFTETVAFNDETSAREGEAGHEPPPPEVAAALQEVMESATFYDLREPWFESP